MVSSGLATSPSFEITSKRRRGFPSETRVKSGRRGVTTSLGTKEFLEKLGRNDLCPCGSGRRFQEVLPPLREARRLQPRRLHQGVTVETPPERRFFLMRLWTPPQDSSGGATFPCGC
ncbi:MAG: SEC-C domain-containing protein [Phycisphaerales bacterium]|nr:SEC-C domain-containing protein [Phycisphaerales bacterium]